MPERIRAAVVGAGRLGTLHGRKYAALEAVSVDYVVDVDPARADKLAREVGARPLTDYRALRGRVDAATVATPGTLHHEVAAFLLDAGIDVLLEKPMAATLEQARDLAAISERAGRILQIGHLERFNPAIVRLRPLLRAPRFIECHRLSPFTAFTERGTDVDVILDLMTHDLDVVLSVSGAGIAAVEAIGVAVLTDSIDVANARLRLADGMIANLNTSRVATKRERKIRFFQPDAYISLDYEARTIQIYRKSAPPPGGSFPSIGAEHIDLSDGDPLADEVASFVKSVRTRGAPAVTAQEGLRVMEASQRIHAAIRDSAEQPRRQQSR